MKLGRKFPTRAKLKLSKYLGHALPMPPSACDWSLAMTEPWGMMLNDTEGDCTCAGLGHAVQTVTANTDGLITPTDDMIQAMYEQSGFTPGYDSTDQGWTEVDAMKYMVTNGLAGVKMDAFADIDHSSILAVKQCIYLFGGCYIGVVITAQDMDDFGNGKPWTSTDMSNIDGGHALFCPKYDETSIYAVTWGALQQASWQWVRSKCDEAHACLFTPWVRNSVNTDPDGFDFQQLKDDLAKL